MPSLQFSILVVDDANFPSAIMDRALRNAGYREIRFAERLCVPLHLESA